MLKTSVERLEGIAVKLTVTVPAEQVDAGIEKTYKAIGSKVKIPGFRPGKAPRPMLDSMIGRDYILQEATEEVVNTSYPLALDAEMLRPIESPEMSELDAVEPGTDYTYTAEIDLRPELALSDTKKFEVALPPAEATQRDIDLRIDDMRERFATLEPVEDRGVEADDFVLLSFVGTVDGEAYEGNTVDRYLYEMSRGQMPVEFDQAMLGAKPGDEVRAEFEIPDTSSNPEFVGKMAAFDITVHEIKAKKLPEIDDEFAANLGFETVEEMTADLKSRLDVQAATEFDRLKERRSRELVATRLEGDVPDVMIDSRTQTMLRDFMSMLDTRGMTLDQYLGAAGVTADVLQADMRVQGEQSVREDLALEALFRAKGMEVTSEDIDAELVEVAEATNSTPEEARQRWQEMGLMAVIHEQIMHRKAVDWLLENVTVTLEEAAADEQPAVEGKKKAAPKKKAAAKKAPKAEEAPEPAAESTEE